MKPKKMASVIIASRKKDGTVEAMPEDEMHPKLVEAAEKMVSAIHEKDASKVAEAIKLAHEHLSGDLDASNEVEE